MNKLYNIGTFFLILIASHNIVGAEESHVTVVTLEQCFEYAKEHNFNLRKNRIEKERSSWSVLSARAKYAFNLNTSAIQDIENDSRSYSVSLDKTFPMDLNVKATVTKSDLSNEGTASISISKVIIGDGTLESSNQSIQDAIINELVAQNNIEQDERDLRLTIVRAYYRVIRNAQTLSIQKRQLKRSHDNKDRAVERDRLLDIATSDIQVAESEDRVIRAEQDLATSRDALKRSMGMPLEEVLHIASEFSFQLQDFDQKTDWEYTQVNHVDFLNYHLNLKIIERDLRIQKTQLLPQVSLEYDLSQGSTNEFDFKEDLTSSVGLSLSWTFGNMADTSAYQRALLRYEISQVDFEDIYQRKLLELRNLSRDREVLTRSLEIAQRRLAFQERSTALYADRYQNGEIDILEFIRNQDALENTRIDLLRQKIRYIEKVAEYNLAIGK